MLEERPQHRVLIVSDADKIADYITELLSPREFSPILRAGSAGDAKRMLLSAEYDIVIINSPLPTNSERPSPRIFPRIRQKPP